MKIKGHDIRIVEHHANEPWPRSVSYDGQRMDYNNLWESRAGGAVIYYKSPEDKSIFQGVGISRKDLLRVIESESTTATVETDGLYHYEIHGSKAHEAAERMEQRLDLLSRSVEHGIISGSVYQDELPDLRQSIEREFSVSIDTVVG